MEILTKYSEILGSDAIFGQFLEGIHRYATRSSANLEWKIDATGEA